MRTAFASLSSSSEVEAMGNRGSSSEVELDSRGEPDSGGPSVALSSVGVASRLAMAFGRLAIRALRKSQKLSLFGSALQLVQHIHARASRRTATRVYGLRREG